MALARVGGTREAVQVGRLSVGAAPAGLPVTAPNTAMVGVGHKVGRRSVGIVGVGEGVMEAVNVGRIKNGGSGTGVTDAVTVAVVRVRSGVRVVDWVGTGV